MNKVFTLSLIAVFLIIGCDGVSGPDGQTGTEGDRLWVVDKPASRILIFKLDGTLLHEIGGFPEFVQPNGIDIYQADGSAWVIDFYADTLTKFDRDGNKLFQTTTPDGEEATLRQPTSLAVDQLDGSVWVADYMHYRVVRFDENGDIIGTINGFSYPRSVSLVGSSGDCWVSDENTGSLYRFDGDLTGDADVTDAEITAGGFDTPRFVKALADGGCWVLDIGVDEAVHISPGGDVIATITGFGNPTFATPSPVGDDILVTDDDYEAIWAIDASATGEKTANEVGGLFITGIADPSHISVDRERERIFVSETGEDCVSEYDANTGAPVLEYGPLEGPVATGLFIDRTD
jgi:DNA-binding beta-propeller fold protein YncE